MTIMRCVLAVSKINFHFSCFINALKPKRNLFNCEGGAQRGVCGASTSKDELRHHGLCEDCNRSVTDIDDDTAICRTLNHGLNGQR